MFYLLKTAPEIQLTKTTQISDINKSSTTFKVQQTKNVFCQWILWSS